MCVCVLEEEETKKTDKEVISLKVPVSGVLFWTCSLPVLVCIY